MTQEKEQRTTKDIEIPGCIKKVDSKLAKVFVKGKEVDWIWLITAPKQNLITGQWTALASVNGALCLIECTPRFKEAA